MIFFWLKIINNNIRSDKKGFVMQNRPTKKHFILKFGLRYGRRKVSMNMDYIMNGKKR